MGNRLLKLVGQPSLFTEFEEGPRCGGKKVGCAEGRSQWATDVLKERVNGATPASNVCVRGSAKESKCPGGACRPLIV